MNDRTKVVGVKKIRAAFAEAREWLETDEAWEKEMDGMDVCDKIDYAMARVEATICGGIDGYAIRLIKGVKPK